ncbi:DUF2213 domain-containing protein [Cronobacter sakazakii]|uniref:DUF2213 domain-containing protein n=4 Tax=Cronobacter sakazakii TaxID=28141 RepID=UPI000DA1F127|nr:DUF2213 domain-containing protein [Cronobacter sakazakii]EKA0999397.1 DUF2213 domain-containing protein [Cronobacter sakazakii]EKF1803309.1 DUF2213 domain-containing protein [Cronobacter sakazakii]EKY2076689.1 DUF2213 domain-containing protein [Cronobacter sakazakii]EKY2089341.1 DUF2213 domain-containing protein [Cronobacter sakazakii]ELY2556110.1 DUF2213 domain-containing protein [Cronobacter sakazakii]
MKLSSIHVKSLAINSSNISTETIDGDEHIVIRGVVPVVDDVVMNGGLYPAEEINKSFKTLEGNPMPFGHPKIGNEHVSATNPRAVNQFHVGAWAENVRKDGDRVVMDMKVNKRIAQSSEKGKRLIERLDELQANSNAEPIHVSTGLLLRREQNSGKSKGKSYSWVARNMQFDHVAILLDEPGAATPEEGVGIFVNADNSQQEVSVENADLAQASNCTREGLLNKTKFFFTNASNFSFDDIQRAISDKLREGRDNDDWVWPESVWPDSFVYRDADKYFKQKYLIDDDGKAQFVGEPVEVVRKPPEYEIKTNGERDPMKDMIINALKAAGKPTEGKSEAELLDAFNQMAVEKAASKGETPEEKAAREKKEAEEKSAKDKATNSEEAPAWFKPFADKLSSIESGLTANADQEKATKREAVKAKFKLDDMAVNALDGAALDGLYAQCATSRSLSGAFNHSTDKPFSEMPE